ncbi:hypothetical protein HDU76_007672 [Blyttiomyces sp. JEL0837]|nr:hypothetical protein HDU76_007672 [Blyttiomyces sp. JEL0837]
MARLHTHINCNSYGGPVIQNVQIHPIYYGNAKHQNELNNFYKAIANSSYIEWLSEYNTANPPQKIGIGKFIGNYTETKNIKTNLEDVADIQPYLIGLAKAGVIQPNGNTFYPIHLAPGITVKQHNLTSCQVFCAYHGTAQYNGGYIYYSVVPDQETGGCNGGCGNDPQVFNNLCYVSAHEVAEGITDPAVGIGSQGQYPRAWDDPMFGEIADMCNGIQDSFIGFDGVKYMVSALWSNELNDCIVKKGPTSSTTSTSTPTHSGTCAHSGPTSSTTSTSTPTHSGTCAHSVCVVGVKLQSGCDPCATKIIASDSYCGTGQWDSYCVGAVKTVCNITC